MIKIGGHKLDVEWVDMEPMGEYLRELSLIRVKSGMTEDQEMASVLHEVLHHIWAEAGLRAVLGDDLEERIVVAFEQGMLSFIKDNPGLVEAMMAKKKKQKKKTKVKKNGY